MLWVQPLKAKKKKKKFKNLKKYTFGIKYWIYFTSEEKREEVEV